MKKNKGFTLLELVLVLILLSLGVYLVVPSMARLATAVELKGTAQKIAGILRYYRMATVQKGQVHQILIDQKQRELIVRALKSGKKEGTDFTWTEKIKYQIPAGINLQEEICPGEYNADLPAIEFYPTGQANGGQILLVDPDQQGYRIKISFLTGLVEVEKI
ncbi:MAG: prepilin-type N-terminal cleavage/methylation domain-containing protein [Thermodesulfobacteriota bacterium]